MELSNENKFLESLEHKSSFPASSQVKHFDRAKYAKVMPIETKFSTETFLTQLYR